MWGQVLCGEGLCFSRSVDVQWRQHTRLCSLCANLWYWMSNTLPVDCSLFLAFTLICLLFFDHLELKHLLQSAASLRVLHLELRRVLSKRLIFLADYLWFTTTGVDSPSTIDLVLDALGILFLLCDLAPSHVASKLVLLSQGILVHPLQVSCLLERNLFQLFLREVMLLRLCRKLWILGHSIHLLGPGRAHYSKGSRNVFFQLLDVCNLRMWLIISHFA